MGLSLPCWESVPSYLSHLITSVDALQVINRLGCLHCIATMASGDRSVSHYPHRSGHPNIRRRGGRQRDAGRRKHKHFCPGSHRLMEGTHRLVGIEIYTINPRNDHICRIPNSGMMAARQLSEAIKSHHVEA